MLAEKKRLDTDQARLVVKIKTVESCWQKYSGGPQHTLKQVRSLTGGKMSRADPWPGQKPTHNDDGTPCLGSMKRTGNAEACNDGLLQSYHIGEYEFWTERTTLCKYICATIASEAAEARATASVNRERCTK